MTGLIFAILLALPRHTSDLDELDAHRTARLAMLAVDIASAADKDKDKAAALIVLGLFEGAHFSRWVGAGCRGKPPPGTGNCDGGASRSYWQMKHRACRPGWAHARGSRAAQRAFATCAARLWGSAKVRCQRGAEGAFAGYWKSCRGLPDAEARAVMHRRIVTRLY